MVAKQQQGGEKPKGDPPLLVLKQMQMRGKEGDPLLLASKWA
jgi:hypothetical protein